ncbi:MAG: outer membrane protein assembly factor BamA [Alphaproteobacteria bacterium]
MRKWGSMRPLAILAVVMGMIGLGMAAKAQQGGPAISAIVVEGNQRIESETVRSYLTVQEGDPLDPFALNDSLRALFASGLFRDADLTVTGTVVTVTVDENPIINRVVFEGNDRIDTDVLEAEIQSRPRIVYTQTQVADDADRILEVYRRSGRYAAAVDPQIITLDQNRVDLVFEVEEGPLTGVDRISFVGNRAFGDGTLRGEILTEESAWWRILSSSDNYDPDRLTFDRELLRNFYLSEGYADFRVVSAVAELAPEGDGFFVTFTVEEGERYSFGAIDVQSALPDLSPEELRSEITTFEGDWYDAEAVEASIQAMTARLGELGYAFAEVRPRIERDRDNLLIGVTYDIQQGPRVYVQRIDIVGNVRTQDQVIRREMRLVEGDAFNTARLRRSEQEIRDLDFFETVDVSSVPGDAPDQTVIVVEVEEKSTGELSIGAGYSTNDGALADFSLRERNLLGQGQDLRLGLSLATSRQEIDLSFTEPYFLDRRLAAGFDIFRITRDQQDVASYDSEETGFALRAGYNINESLSQNWTYTLRQDSISNVPSDASIFVREQEGDRITSSIGQQLLFDQRDSRVNPTEGYFLRAGTEFAGLGGDVTFFRATAGAGYYYPVAEEVVASLSAEAGMISGIGEDVRIFNRFFIGGRDLRGFRRGGIGPRDLFTDDALGGNTFFTGSAEMSFPLGLPEELGLTGAVFADFGTLTGLDSSGPTVVDSGSIRSSVGIGVLWDSPFGPVRVDVSQPVSKESYDETERFSLSFGTRF